MRRNSCPRGKGTDDARVTFNVQLSGLYTDRPGNAKKKKPSSTGTSKVGKLSNYYK